MVQNAGKREIDAYRAGEPHSPQCQSMEPCIGNRQETGGPGFYTVQLMNCDSNMLGEWPQLQPGVLLSTLNIERTF